MIGINLDTWYFFYFAKAVNLIDKDSSQSFSLEHRQSSETMNYIVISIR